MRMDEAQKSMIEELDDKGDYNQEEGILDADQFREDSGNENNLSIFSIYYNNKYSNFVKISFDMSS